MPLLRIHTSAATLRESSHATLLKTLSAELARALHKPERYVMVILENTCEMIFEGNSDPACFAVLKNIGTFTPAQTDMLSALLTEHLSRALGVPPKRVYLEFVDAKPHLWGYDGATFA